MSEPILIVLPFELTNGNDGRGSKWFKSANVRNKFEKELRLRRMVWSPFLWPVKFTVTRVLGPGQRLWDSSSIGRGNWKEMEDALVACGLVFDDRPKYVTSTDFRQDECRRSSGPFTELLIEQDGEPFGASKGDEKDNLI